MKRDFDILRKLLLAIDGKETDLDSSLAYHLKMLCEGELISIESFGKDFIENFTDENKWKEMKERFTLNGLGISGEIIKDLISRR